MPRTSLRTCGTFLVIAGSLSAGLGATPALAQSPSVSSAPSVIVSTGTSTIRVAPDQAWVSVSVDTRDSRGTEARRLGAVAMTSVRAALDGAAVPDDAVKTSGFSLRPEYDYVNGKQLMRGFVVSNQLQVRVDDVGRVADVLDAVAALSLPASSTVTIGNLRFDLKDRAAVERRALTEATADATARARAMADGAGRRTGLTLRIEEAGAAEAPVHFPEPMMASRAGDAMVATPISPSDIVITVTVRVTMQLM